MKKVHPMEERYLRPQKREAGIYQGRNYGCPEMQVEEMIKAIKKGYVHGPFWEQIEFTRQYCDETYKNGAKNFDKAMKFLNSPLIKALS